MTDQDPLRPQHITECRRCGICCTKGGPTLHHEDRRTIEAGHIPLRDLYTIRPGEMVHDNVRDRLETVDVDLIKIRGSGNGWTCCYLDDVTHHCRIYRHRPLECRLLRCWDTADIEAAYHRSRLSRKDLLQESADLYELVREHSQKCDFRRLRQWIDEWDGTAGHPTVQAVVDAVSHDLSIRRVLAEKGGMDPRLFDFLFGRPLTATLHQFGLRVQENVGNIIIRPAAATPGGSPPR